MPYYYHESTKLSQQDALALRSLASTGELPNNHYWNTLRTQHDANVTRFDRTHNYVISALLDRDQLQREGVLNASSPLFSRTTGFFGYAGGKHDLNSIRFDYYHPFLGRLFEITLPPALGGQGLTNPPTNPPTSPTSPPIGPNPPTLPPPGSDGGGGGTTTPIPTPTPNAVPEPSSVILMGLALLCALVGTCWKRRSSRQDFPAHPAVG